MVTATLQALSHDGRGITTVDQKTTFVAGGLPGETVALNIFRKKPTFYEAIATEIITPSKSRATPPCAHFGVCGGCSLQHMNMTLQLEMKQQTLLDQLKHFGNVVPNTILPPLHTDELGYRRKARLGVKFVIKKNKLLIGFREKSSRYLADIESCPVLYPNVGEHLDELRALIQSLSCFDHIAQVEVAVGDDTIAYILRHLKPLTPDDHEKIIAFAKTHHIHFYLQPNPPLPVTKLWPDDGKARLSYTLPAFDLEFLFHPLDFTQINLEMNRRMISQALQLLDLQKEDAVLDLFCGIGNFTLPMAKYAKQVIGVEGSQEMVERAYENAKHNDINNVQFFAANLEAPSSSASWLKQSYDKILLDPPRVGAKSMLPILASLNAKKIVYVSCNPATLSRDAGELVHHHGYQLEAAGIMNMFPHTSHIEAMALLTKHS